MQNFLSGYKTYITAASLILTAIAGYASGNIGLEAMVAGIFNGIGMITIRAGIKADTSK